MDGIKILNRECRSVLIRTTGSETKLRQRALVGITICHPRNEMQQLVLIATFEDYQTFKSPCRKEERNSIRPVAVNKRRNHLFSAHFLQLCWAPKYIESSQSASPLDDPCNMATIDYLRSNTSLIFVGVGTVVWIIYVVVNRLFLGPLAKFPGPRLAALTGWYETYHECFKRGTYWVKIERMHLEYGTSSFYPVPLFLQLININPHRPNSAHQPLGIARK